METIGKAINQELQQLQKPPDPTPEVTRNPSFWTNYPILPEVPPRYQGWTLADFEPKLVEAIRPFLSRKVMTLFLHSSTNGTRKSSFAAGVLRARYSLYPSENVNGYFGFVTADMLREAAVDFVQGKYRLAAWKEKPLLVLDDLGALRNTPHVTEEVCRLVSVRYDHLLSTVITANLTLTELSDFLDPRIASRLQEGLIIDMGSHDYRGDL
jgi:hypothetical protein